MTPETSRFLNAFPPQRCVQGLFALLLACIGLSGSLPALAAPPDPARGSVRAPVGASVAASTPARGSVRAPVGAFVTPLRAPSLAPPGPLVGDRDNDGYRAVKVGGTDCDDTNPNIHPGATEICNSIDDDCDAQIDEGAGSSYYPDQDSDGWGWAQGVIQACKIPSGYLTTSGDCNDQDAAVHPVALELMDGRDQDCDGIFDEQAAMPALIALSQPTVTPRRLGDLNGDGYDDFVIPGATFSNLYLGGPWLSHSFDQSFAEARLDTTLCPGTFKFRALGDLNNDGMDELGFQCSSSSDYTQNYLYIYLGRTRFSTFTLKQIDSSIVSTQSNQVLTTVASHGGDLNGDGHADLLLGMADDSTQSTLAGRVALFLGGKLWPIGTSVGSSNIWINGQPNEHLGYAVENVGDLDGDGSPEVFVTDYASLTKQRFQVFSHLGSRLGQWSVSETSAVLYSDQQSVGIRTAYVGDITGDRIDDLVMGDGYTLYLAASDKGATYLDDIQTTMSIVSTRTIRYATPAPNTYFNLDFRAAGDINGDGYGDMLVGAWGGVSSTGSASGGVQVILGLPFYRASSSWPAASSIVSVCTGSYCQCGMPGSFDGSGDFDGDGYSDFLVGGIDAGAEVLLGY